MKCPLCSKEFSIDAKKERNMEIYRNKVVARTNCCQQLVNCTPVFTYEVSPYNGTKTLDSWDE